MSSSSTARPYIVIGGGPSGLAAAYELCRHRRPVTIFEKSDLLGGLSRTECYRGYCFDMGGHRFFTKSGEIEALWKDLLGDDFLVRPRLSRIFYQNRFFHYPLKPVNALLSLGLWESFRVLASYLRWSLLPYRTEETFDRWVTNRFGQRLFKIFFESYTEKVWGIPCSEIRADWAAQRIMNLSLRSAVLNMFIKQGSRIKTLIEAFHYPKRGPGMLWEALSERIAELGGNVQRGARAVALHHERGRVHRVTVERGGERITLAAEGVISSMPLPEFIRCLEPAPPASVLDAAARLHYRDFLTVCLIVDSRDLFPDNWIYVHDPSVRVGRIQNFKNWSPDMVADPEKSSLGLEYFCDRGDDLWQKPDAELIDLAKTELRRIGLADPDAVVGGTVYRVENAYPVYDGHYANAMAVVKPYLSSFENVQSIGRSGLHRYDNQDHAMLTGIYAGRNLLDGARLDLWAINADGEYHEQFQEAKEPAADRLVSNVEEVIARVFPKIDTISFAGATGVVTGLMLALATLFLTLKGGRTGPTLHLLNQFFPGYHVSVIGSLTGFFYGFLTGAIAGWTGSLLRNTLAAFYFIRQYRSAERKTLRSVLDFLL